MRNVVLIQLRVNSKKHLAKNTSAVHLVSKSVPLGRGKRYLGKSVSSLLQLLLRWRDKLGSKGNF